MNWITKKEIEGKIKTKHRAIEMSIHHWLQLSTASLNDFKDIVAEYDCIPMENGECGLCEFSIFEEHGDCDECLLHVNGYFGCCPEYDEVAKYRSNLENNLTYKDKRKFQRAAKKLLIRLLQIKYKEG